MALRHNIAMIVKPIFNESTGTIIKVLKLVAIYFAKTKGGKKNKKLKSLLIEKCAASNEKKMNDR